MTKKVLLQQLSLPGFITTQEEYHIQWALAIDKYIKEIYPITQEEADILPLGLKLSRHVPTLECEKCKFACEDHSDGGVWPILICLKDLRSLKGE